MRTKYDNACRLRIDDETREEWCGLAPDHTGPCDPDPPEPAPMAGDASRDCNEPEDGNMNMTKDATKDAAGDNAPVPPLITKYKVRPLVHAELGDTEARCVRAKPRSVRGTALEPLWGAELFSMAEIELTDGTSKYAFVFRRERPFIPHGTDPKKVNDECSRLFAVIPRERTRAIAEGMVTESATSDGVAYGDFPDGEWFDVVEIMP